MVWKRIVRLVLAWLVLGALAACGPDDSQSFPVIVEAQASPTCPVEAEPPDPECAPRPVEGATIRVIESSGRVVETLITDASGTATTSLPAGTYTFRPEPVEGLPGTPDPETLEVADDLPGLGVTFRYDTGIRAPGP